MEDHDQEESGKNFEKAVRSIYGAEEEEEEDEEAEEEKSRKEEKK